MDNEVDVRGPTAQAEDECRQTVDVQQRVGHRPGERHRVFVVADPSTGDADSVEGPEDDDDEQKNGCEYHLDVLEPRQRGGRPHPLRRAADQDQRPDRNDDEADSDREEGRLAGFIAPIITVV